MLGDRRRVHRRRPGGRLGRRRRRPVGRRDLRAFELGVTFFDTADAYGTGRSEQVLGRALAGHRDEVVIATKFGYTYDTSQQALTGENASPGYIRTTCQASLRRLGSERIDLYGSTWASSTWASSRSARPTR